MARSPKSTLPQIDPSEPATIPLNHVASALAPFIYFENAPTFGFMNGVISVTLEAGQLTVAEGGKVATHRVTVAHLRMNALAAESLRNALESALQMAAKPAMPAPDTSKMN